MEYSKSSTNNKIKWTEAKYNSPTAVNKKKRTRSRTSPDSFTSDSANKKRKHHENQRQPQSPSTTTLPNLHQIGDKHPSFHDSLTSLKVKWSEEELKYLRRLIQSYLTKDYETNRPLIMSLCLKAIRADPTALRIFHRRHIMNSATLRSGWDNLQKKFDNLV
jgi:hypothetical protein